MKIERNDVCTCGSGKKYKKCCLRQHQKEDAEKKTVEKPHFILKWEPEVQKACDNALILLERGDYAGGKKLAAPLIRDYPENHDVCFLQASFFINEENYEEAIVYLEKATKIFPYFSDAYFNLGMLYYKLARLPKSIKAFREVINLEEEKSSTCRKAREMIEEMEVLIRKYRNMSLDEYILSDEVYNRAYSCLMEKKYEEAILLFQKSISICPEHVQSYGNIALAYSGLGQNKKAVECLDKALSLDPDYEPALINRRNLIQMEEGEELTGEINSVNYYREKAERKKIQAQHIQTSS